MTGKFASLKTARKGRRVLRRLSERKDYWTKQKREKKRAWGRKDRRRVCEPENNKERIEKTKKGQKSRLSPILVKGLPG